MRIAHICQWFIPGLSYQENFLPQEQARLGHDVWILTSDRVPPRLPADRDRFAPGFYEEDSVHICRLPSVMPIKSRGQVYLRNLLSTLREIEPEIIHIHGLWYLPTLQIMASRTRCTLVADDHADNGNLPSGPGNLIRFGFARWVCKRLCRQGGKIFSVNPFSRWFVTEVLHTPPDSVHFLPLGINTQTFYPDPAKRTQARTKLNLPRDACVFITTGRLTPGKGFELLIERFGEVYRAHPASRLIIIGSGSEAYETQLQRLAKESGIEDAFILLAWMAQDDLCTYYNAADVGVLPGKLGGIREILGVGRPLIVPDHLATGYFIEGGNGLAFSPGDPSSLGQAMLRYVRQPALRQEHGGKALEVARAHLSWRAIAADSLQVYSGLPRSQPTHQRKARRTGRD